MMGYPKAPALDAMLESAAKGAPAVDVTADDGVRHQLWVVSAHKDITALTQALDTLPALYIADGHHRSAAAARVAHARAVGSTGEKDGSNQYVLSVIFPHHEMTILDYNRVLRDLHGRSPEALLAELRKNFAVTPSGQPVRPAAAGEFGMYLGGCWYLLT